MPYSRVIPRDLFNEANLLKCYGQLYLKLETGTHCASIQYAGEGDPNADWNIQQDPASGAIYADNLLLWITGTNPDRPGQSKVAYLTRPLNSRAPWPLWLERLDGEELDDPFEVFTDEGELSDDFKTLIGWERA
jgi:hypothetical protein